MGFGGFFFTNFTESERGKGGRGEGREREGEKGGRKEGEREGINV